MKLIKTENYYNELSNQLNRSYKIAKPYRHLCKLMGLSDRLSNYMTVQFVKKTTGLNIAEIFKQKEGSEVNDR